MATICDRSFDASKTSLELLILEGDSLSNGLKVLFNSGEYQLEFDFFVLRNDLEMFYTLILNNWDELLKEGVWDSTDPSFSFSIFKNESELIDGPIYQFQFWIDAGEFNSQRSTRSGIGITIHQDRESIEQFALQIKNELN